MELGDRPTTLYRAFDADGELVYIGVAVDWGYRWAQHRVRSSWFAEVVRVELEEHPDRPSALAAEAVAIKAELPRHNIAHTERDTRRWLAREPALTVPSAPKYDHRRLLPLPEYLALRKALVDLAHTKPNDVSLAEVAGDLIGALWYLDLCATCAGHPPRRAFQSHTLAELAEMVTNLDVVVLPTVTVPDLDPGAPPGWFRAHYSCERCGAFWTVGWSTEIQDIGIG